MELMEVTGTLSKRASAARFDFGEDTAIVAVQHMLWQTVDLFDAVAALGAKRENIFALGKVYSNSPVVIGALRDRGITVVPSTTPEPGEFDESFQRDVDHLWEVVARGIADRGIQRILVLDDGGRCITSMPPELLRRYAASSVEQTSLGAFLLEEQPPPFAVMSWARAAVKLHLGGPLFSHCLLEKLQSRVLGGTPLTGGDVGIIGMGSIGTATAHLIARQGNPVIFYDPDPDLHVSPYVQGRVTRVDSLEELLSRCEYVIGCSGRHPFEGHWPLKHRPGIKLFSGSSSDHEFGPIIEDLKTKRDFNITSLDWDIQSGSGPSGPISIAYLGYPYNFVSRDIEAVPTGVVQIETGGLLASLIQAHVHLGLCQEGQAENRGAHRISPEAQRFVCETWQSAMKSRGIDLELVYGYDPAMLETARSLSWLAANSEPRPSPTYEPNHDTEAAMSRMVGPDTGLGQQ